MLEFNSIATLGAARNLLSGSIKKNVTQQTAHQE